MLRPLEQHYLREPDLAAGQAGPTQAIKYILVLGGGHTLDPKLAVTSWIESIALYRVVEGVRLYKAGPGRKLILSGGAGFDPLPEAQTISRLALIMGVKPQDIPLESGSRDTEDQARLIKTLVGREKFFLVTSAFHLPRAMPLFQKQGLAPVAAPAGQLVRQSQSWSSDDFFANSGGLYRVEMALHEYLGLAWPRLRGGNLAEPPSATPG